MYNWGEIPVGLDNGYSWQDRQGVNKFFMDTWL